MDSFLQARYMFVMSGFSKRESQQRAAKEALEKLRNRDKEKLSMSLLPDKNI